MKPSYQQLAIEDGHDHFAVAEFERTVHDQDISVKNARFLHRIALHPEKESGRLVTDQLFIQINAFLCIVVRGGTKAGGIGRADLLLGKLLRALIGCPKK